MATTIDEVGKFWVVTTPSGTSELDDILFECTVAEMSRLAGRGRLGSGLDPKDILGLFTDRGRAEAFALDRLETQRLAADKLARVDGLNAEVS